MAVKPIKTTPLLKRAANAWSYVFSGGRLEFYPGGQSDQRRLPNTSLARDITELMSENRQRMLIGDGRYIYQAFPLVSGAVRQKADYVYGTSWRLQSLSEDEDFRAAVEKDFKQIDSMLDIRGPGYSFRGNTWLLSKALDVDGDCLIILTESKHGFPLLQYVEAHRLGNWENDNQPVVQEGKWKGRRIHSGVIVNDFNTPVAYRISEESGKAGYRDLPASAVIHVSDREWFSQSRGQPAVCAGILDWYDLAETKDAQKIKTKVNSALTLVESNEAGKIDTGNATVNPGGGGGGPLQTQLMDSGMIRYIKNGGSLTAHTANDPSEGWLKFTRQVQAEAMYGLRWRRELFDGEQLARAGARGVVNDVNAAIRARCSVLLPVMRRAALYIIAKRAKMGTYDLPDDWWKVAFTPPAEFTVDEGKMRKADLDDLRAGLTTEDDIVERRGQDLEEVYRKRAASIVLKKKIAEEHGLTPDELGTLSQPGDPGPLDTSTQE